MILVDTSPWVDHLRRGNARLASLLEDGEVACHRFVIGELALGNLENRSAILEYLSNLPSAPVAEHDEVVGVVERRRLMGTGIGWVDAHLLASCLLAHLPLWTLDKPLATQARRLGVAAE
ncbi:MAG: VapC toxin family PIN domain ribonuclease [Gemmatimonadetes bacterium]|nr:VapC toxin family PIN domain ribonuclease [Gemmatimonadota bacterium]MBI2615630.1 VapC toxin family PIN domain ribonuclease [Gemmatimonadota bacterium]